MRRLLLGLACGIALASAAQGEEPPVVTKLNEVPLMEPAGRNAFTLPSRYGRLVNATVSAEVHYLYFEDATGTVRVVLIGPPGAVSRARQQFQLLSPDVTLIKRGMEHNAS